jgi:probable lipoprotein NlpC
VSHQTEFSWDKFVGLTYKHGGRGPLAYDCWGLILAIYKERGVDLWDIAESYEESKFWHAKNFFLENYHRDWERVDDTPKPFDVILFNNDLGLPVHAGVVVTPTTFIHAQRKNGVTISRLFGREWEPRIEGVYRYRGHA